MFVPLHVKSAYSLGIGTASVEKLVERASAMGIRAMALTDVDNLYGALVFQRLARARGIRPILGAEIPLGIGRRLVLLVRSRAGYENLSRIITRRKLDAAFDPLASLPALAGGLFIMTDHPETMARILAHCAVSHCAVSHCAVSHCAASHCAIGGGTAGGGAVGAEGIDRAALRFLLVRPSPELESGDRRVVDSAAAWGIPLVADADIGFLDPADHALHRVLVAIREHTVVSEVAEPLSLGPARYFPGPREWADRFADQPEAMRETERIAALCDLDFGSPRPIFPRIDLPPGETAYSALARRCFKGLEARYPHITSRALARLDAELAVIERLGFCEYFLVVGDIVERARSRGIEVVGRGSGASSIVAYILGVTNVDPIAYGLYFERFLHAQRPDLPDIDIDLCWIRRDEVIADVYRSYGDDRVAMISSHITFQPRSAFREAARAFGAPATDVDRYSKLISHRLDIPLSKALDESPVGREIPRHEEPYRSAIASAELLLGLPHHLSIHPGGIVIGDRPLDAYVPLERASKGVVITQYDMHSIEDVGLVKIDLLGNRCLTEIQDTLCSLPSVPSRGRERPASAFRLQDIPDGDPKTAQVLREGNTIGCFQIESPAMRALLRQLRVETVRDTIVAVALIRPGPSEGGMKDCYLRRADGEERVEYLCPRLQEVLEENHGVMLYEEDVMRVAAAVAGISLAEGDVLRSRLKKVSSNEELREMENDFLRRAIGSGVAPDVASAVWKDILRFSRYTFNKAHAAGYGLLAYQAAYLKAHHPVEFACALLNNHAGMYGKRTIAEDARRGGVKFLPPCVNRSGRRHQIEDSGADASKAGEREESGRAVRLALAQVKGLSVEAIDAILGARPFRSLGDLLRRTCIPKREVEALILSGAVDFTGLNRPQLLWELETTYERERGRGSLGLAAVGGDDWSRLRHPPLKDYPAVVKVRHEMEYLDLALTAHPLALFRDRIAALGCTMIAEALQRPGERVRVAGLVAASRRTPTKKGETMQFLTLEDETGILETTLFPKVFRRYAKQLGSLGPYIVEGMLKDRRRALSLDVEQLSLLDVES